MKSFKQYITESISSHADQIKNVLHAAALEHGFDPRDLESHRRTGTHGRLLTSDDGSMDIHHSVGGTPESISGRTNRYSFKIPGLDKRHNPEVYMSINSARHHDSHLTHFVDFLFGENYGMHPTLLPHERSDVMNHVFNGVMRSLAHFTIADRIDPNRDRFNFEAVTNELPTTTSSGKTRRVTPAMQKRRLYQNMMNSLMQLHSQLRSR